MNFQIGNRCIGPGEPVFLIAELSGNHHQSYDEAVRLLRAAHEAGADAVKLQTYTADTITLRCCNDWFRRTAQVKPGEPQYLFELYDQAYTPWEWQPRLMAEAQRLGVILFSTPFDATAVDFLEQIQVPAHKIASFELVDIPLLEKVARTGKPVIMSTGMASLDEISEAVAAIRGAGNQQLALLKCTSAYPARVEDMNLRTIPDLAARFNLPVGLSDHTLDLAVPVASVALGACIIEKHLTLERAQGGPDASFSLEPSEFRQMVETVRKAEAALGKINYEPTPDEIAERRCRRSLFVVEDVKAGDVFTENNVRSIRPGYGLPPKYLPDVLGRRATRDIMRGTPLTWALVS
jgi:N-acetylneuraminate synthase